MRCSKEIADIITDNLRTNNNIEMWNYDDLFKELNLVTYEKKLINNVLDVLIFSRVLTFDIKLMCWRNNYYDSRRI